MLLTQQFKLRCQQPNCWNRENPEASAPPLPLKSSIPTKIASLGYITTLSSLLLISKTFFPSLPRCQLFWFCNIFLPAFHFLPPSHHLPAFSLNVKKIKMFPVLRPGIPWMLRIHCDIGRCLRTVLFSKRLLWIPTLRRICSIFRYTNSLTATTSLAWLQRIAKKAVTLEIKDNATTTQTVVQVTLSIVRQQQMAMREQKHLSVANSHCTWNYDRSHQVYFWHTHRERERLGEHRIKMILLIFWYRSAIAGLCYYIIPPIIQLFAGLSGTSPFELMVLYENTTIKAYHVC